MICDNCQKEIKDGAVYCRYCGKKHNPSIVDTLEKKLNNYGISLKNEKSELENDSIEKEPWDAHINEDPNVINTHAFISDSNTFISLGQLSGMPDWHYYLSEASEVAKQGEIYEALEYVNKAMELQPNEPLIYHRRGILYYELDKDQLAMNDYNMALKLNPKYIYSIINRGVIKSEYGFFKEAIEDYNNALLIDPKSISALNNRAGAKLEIEDYLGAKNDSLSALSISADNGISHYILGKACVKLGEIKEAIINLHKSAQMGIQEAAEELKNIKI